MAGTLTLLSIRRLGKTGLIKHRISQTLSKTHQFDYYT